MMRDFTLRVLSILPLVSCMTTKDTLFTDASRLHTANDLSTVTCLFHAKAVGQPVNDRVRYVGEGSATVRRALRDCSEQDLNGHEN